MYIHCPASGESVRETLLLLHQEVYISISSYHSYTEEEFEAAHLLGLDSEIHRLEKFFWH
jgi:hypothetical protein